MQVGEQVTIDGVAEPGYNGTFTVTAVPISRAFQYTHSVTGLPVSGGGTATHVVPGATWSGGTATIKTSVAHGLAVGDVVTIAGSIAAAGYQGTFTINVVPSARTFSTRWRLIPAGRAAGRPHTLAVQGSHRR